MKTDKIAKIFLTTYGSCILLWSLYKDKDIKKMLGDSWTEKYQQEKHAL